MSQRFHNGINCIAKATAGAPTTGTWAVGDVVCDSVGEYFRCTAAGTPGTWAGMGGTVTFATDREVAAAKAIAATDSRLRTPFTINYIANPDGEIDTTGWAAYADAAGVAPVDGTGGSPVVTITRSTSTPLRGAGSLLITKDAANRQGQGASYAFTIDRSDRSRWICVSFDAEVASGTYASGDILWYVYDVTGAALCTMGGGKAILGTGRQSLSFLATTSTSYRICAHIASASAAAYTVAIDSVMVGPVPVALAPAVHVEASSDAGQVVTASTTTVQWEDVQRGGAWWDGTRFTAPVSGVYDADALYALSYSGIGGLQAYLNGSVSIAGENLAIDDARHGFHGKFTMTAGDYLEFRSVVSGTRDTQPLSNWLRITRIGDA